MSIAHIDMVEAVIGQLNRCLGAFPEGRFFLSVITVAIGIEPCFFQPAGRRCIAFWRRGRRGHRRVIGEILQMAFADQRSPVAAFMHHFDKSVGLQRQRDAVMAHPMDRRRTSGHQRRPVGHADRVRDIEIVEPHAALGDGIDMRRLEDFMAVAAEIIGPVLVGNKQHEVWSFGHFRLPLTLGIFLGGQPFTRNRTIGVHILHLSINHRAGGGKLHT